MKEKKYISNNVLLQIGLLIIILLLFGILLDNIFTFIPGILGAICLYALLNKFVTWLTDIKKINKNVSVLSVLITSIIFIILPLYFILNLLANKIMLLLQDRNKIEDAARKMVNLLKHDFNFDLLSESNLLKVTQVGSTVLQKVISTSLDMFVQLGVAFLLVYFMLLNIKKLKHFFYAIIPFQKRNLIAMSDDLNKLIISNAVGVPLTALIQSIIAYIGYLIFGVDEAFTWFLLTIFAAMLPVVGSAIIYVPLGIFLLSKGENFNGIGLLIYGFTIVGLSDNLIRFVLQKRMADVHPLITIFGVIIGMNLFGFIGIIFGPILFSLFLWLIKLYKSEFIDSNPEK